MKRLLLGITLIGAAAMLGGCPIYPSQREYQVCDSSACYSCPDPTYSSACTGWPCQSDGDCPGGYSCDPNQQVCLAGGGNGYDGGGGGDCSQTGCPAGQICKLSNGGTPQCVTLGGTGDDGGSVDSSTGGDSGSTGDSGTAGDSSSGDGSEGGTPTTCNDDATCGGQGAKCVDGQCTKQVDLCSDTSQCHVAGSACVDGLCEPHCSASAPCPTGSACDLTRGVCNINPDPCTGSGASTCQGGTTCVENHCVPPCTVTEAGSSCSAGQVCVNGGCIPDQGASFACANDGQSGASATTCDPTAICVHHDCYTSCAVDGGNTCVTGTNPTAVCKNVSIETGTYSVCGTPTTLGSDCDPSQGKYCSGGKVCVDGYCQ
jgi:hypothetical protein